MTSSNIEFHTQNNFTLEDEDNIVLWLHRAAKEEKKHIEGVQYIFCDDAYLHKINLEFLKHDNYTDIITFDYCIGDELISDIYISTERVKENAKIYEVSFKEELKRVMIHGLLHLCGYKDKSKDEAMQMREKENFYLSLNS
jgi:probable rRNA maturation factor